MIRQVEIVILPIETMVYYWDKGEKKMAKITEQIVNELPTSMGYSVMDIQYVLENKDIVKHNELYDQVHERRIYKNKQFKIDHDYIENFRKTRGKIEKK